MLGFTSFVVGPMFAVLVITVPGAVPAFTFRTSVNVAALPDGTAAPEQIPPVPGQQLIAPVPADCWKRGQVHLLGARSKRKSYSPEPCR